MELLVNHGLIGLHFHRNLAEGHLRVSTVEFPHDALDALGVTCDYRHGPREIDALECLVHPLIDGEELGIPESAQIDEGGVDLVVFQYTHRIPGGMGLSERGQYLPGCEQDASLIYIARGKDMGQAVEGASGMMDPRGDIVVGFGQVQSDLDKSLIYFNEFA